MRPPTPEIIDLDRNEFTALDERARAKQFRDDDWETARTIFAAYWQLLELLRTKDISLARLLKMLFGASTEKTDSVLDASRESTTAPASGKTDEQTDSSKKSDQKKRPKGHGRNGADAYTGALRIQVRHVTLEAGDPCQECQQGTLYKVDKFGVLVRIVGQAPLQATVYEMEKLRCNLCGEVFTAAPPEGVGPDKYDATAGSMIALLKYGSGLPFNRLKRLQDSLGIPLPAATQWDIVHAKAKKIEAAFEELIRQAAQGDVFYHDDTYVKILEFMGKRAQQQALEEETQQDSQEDEDSQEDSTKKNSPQRTGLFTTGIVSTSEGRRIAVFFTGRKHAGENLKEVLDQRAQELERPIQMCDALSRNMPAELQTVLANCLVHSRRNFVDVADYFPKECEYVLEVLKVIYTNDAEAREQELSPDERLRFHQERSGPIMKELKAWLKQQFDERLVEPNSGLGQAITYMLKHWDKLTLFLRKAGAPLDNNVCERALKKAILHRKNALFFRTQNGAYVGDLFMSLIYTCELSGVSPLDYLNELERHAEVMSANPQDWMPWNYRSTLDGMITARAPPAGPLDSSLAGHIGDLAGQQ